MVRKSALHFLQPNDLGRMRSAVTLAACAAAALLAACHSAPGEKHCVVAQRCADAWVGGRGSACPGQTHVCSPESPRWTTDQGFGVPLIF